jgi:hypothetical protein
MASPREPGKFVAPPRTVSSGAPVDEDRVAAFRRMARPAASSPSPPPPTAPRGASPPPAEPSIARPTLTPSPAAEPLGLPDGVTTHYTPNQMANILRSIDDSKFLPDHVRDFASKLWPEGSVRPDSLWSREGLFSDKERTVKDRKLANQVLGILGRLTPQNYDVLKKELLELPIRQSTDDEITDVVKMMYNKAVRPEDELYTELYANLMADLVQHTGVQGVGKTIRKAIIDKCQHQFEQPFRLTDQERFDEEGNPVPDDELQAKTMQLKAKLRANIKFLGHLFISGMVNEKVVNFVLFTLLYGRDAEKQKKRKPEEYELEMFCDLLKKVVKHLTPKTLTEYIPGYMNSLDNLIPKVSNRIRFLLMDMKELANSNWVEKRRGTTMPKGPVKLDEFEKLESEAKAREQQEFERCAQGQRRGGNQPATPLGPSSPKMAAPPREVAPLPKKDEIYEIMDQYRTDGAASVIEAFFKPIPGKERGAYVLHWLVRIAKQVKKEEERRIVGNVFDLLKQSQLMPASELEGIILQLATRIVVDAMYEEVPKMWTNWADIINSSKTIITQNAHTLLLLTLIRGGEVPTMVDEIVKMVTTVLEAKDPNASHRDHVKRFRPLPAILTFQNPLPDPTLQADEIDAEEEDTGDDDLLAAIVEATSGTGSAADPEIAVFDNLCANTSIPELTAFIQKDASRTDPMFCAKVTSAFFTYARCDTTGAVLDRLREPFQELVKANAQNDSVVVAEAYMTWVALNRQPQLSFRRFMDKMKSLDIITPRSLDTAAKSLDASSIKEFSEETGYRAQAPPPQAAAGPATHGGAKGRR